MTEIDWNIQEALLCLGVDSTERNAIRSIAHSLAAIAQMMHVYMFSKVTHINGVTTWTPPEPCQCKSTPDELAAAAPELLRLVQDVLDKVDGWDVSCPWCRAYYDGFLHHDDCPAAAILKRFEDRQVA